VRIAVDIPDDQVARLERHAARVRARHGRFTRAAALRSAVRYYLDTVDPPDAEAIDSTAVELVDGLALAAPAKPERTPPPRLAGGETR
jgi:hypothetical protein